MRQPRVGGSGAGRAVGRGAEGDPPAEPGCGGLGPEHGRWAGDVRSFVDWCEGASDLDAYRAALETVPGHDAWKAVSRTLHAEIEFTPRPADTGPRAKIVETFRTLDPEQEPLRAAKRRILEAEITRRAAWA